MNELDLIKEVEKRPILYDKSVSGFNKTKLRDKAWKEVQDALNAAGTYSAEERECKKRWRSLRDSYIKLQRTHGGRTRWPYVAAMKFLKHHVIEPKPEDTPAAPVSDSDAEEEKMHSIQCLPDLSYMGDNAYDNSSPPAQPSPKRVRTSSSGDENSNCHCNRNDPDELFLHSCAPTLKRLNSKQNAVARLKIQQALYESEFGTQGTADPPCVTPISDYDGSSQ